MTVNLAVIFRILICLRREDFFEESGLVYMGKMINEKQQTKIFTKVFRKNIFYLTEIFRKFMLINKKCYVIII